MINGEMSGELVRRRKIKSQGMFVNKKSIEGGTKK
jgi:hypothetical protein